MLAVSGGRLLALSTPFGKRGWWHQAWAEGEGWEKIQVTADQCPRITKAFLEDERRSLPAWIFDQEYMCVFGDSVDAVFRYQDIAGMLSDEVTPLFGSADVHPFISSELFPRP